MTYSHIFSSGRIRIRKESLAKCIERVQSSIIGASRQRHVLETVATHVVVGAAGNRKGTRRGQGHSRPVSNGKSQVNI